MFSRRMAAGGEEDGEGGAELFRKRRKNLEFCRFIGGRWKESGAPVTVRLDGLTAGSL